MLLSLSKCTPVVSTLLDRARQCPVLFSARQWLALQCPVPTSASRTAGTPVPSASPAGWNAAPLASAGGTVCIVAPDPHSRSPHRPRTFAHSHRPQLILPHLVPDRATPWTPYYDIRAGRDARERKARESARRRSAVAARAPCTVAMPCVGGRCAIR